jgi:hypothetical protein
MAHRLDEFMARSTQLIVKLKKHSVSTSKKMDYAY